MIDTSGLGETIVSTATTDIAGLTESCDKCLPLNGILNRGLPTNFVSALSAAYSENRWWKSIVNDPELFVTPRKTCVCVYYRGNRLLKLSLIDGRLAGEIHYKYLLHPGLKHPYWSVRDLRVERPDCIDAFIPDFSNLDLFKRASKPYAGEEKYGVSEIIFGNPNIIDAEVAFSDSGNSNEHDDPPLEETVVGKSHHNSPIDFVALQENGTGLKLVFFEAKHFANQELRSDGGDPRVFKQIDEYEKLLENEENRKYIVGAYRFHCADMVNSNCVPEHSDRRHYLSEMSASDIIVDTALRPIVFGFDADQKPGLAWKPHKEKLEEYFGKDRVLLRGNAKGLVRGVRFREP